MFRSIRRVTRCEVWADSAGFTLIEVLVALAVVTVVLGAIGSVVAANVRSARNLDQRMALVQTARGILNELPGRARLTPGNFTGKAADHEWRVDVQPFVLNSVDPARADSSRRTDTWIPQSVVIRVLAPGGQNLRLDTVRLRRAERANQ